MPSICQPQKLASWAARHRWAAAWGATLLISGCAPLPTDPSADGVTATSTVAATTTPAAAAAPGATPDANARPSRWGWWRHDRQGADAVAKVAPPPPKLSDKPEPEVQLPADVTDARDSDQKGVASWYGPGFHGRLTANGERFNSGAMTAAHRSFAFGTRVCVRSSVTGKAVLVRINDRGPYAKNRVIDLSQAAAQELGMMGLGVKPVELWALADDEESCPGDEEDLNNNPGNRLVGLNPEARRALQERRQVSKQPARRMAQKTAIKKQ